MVLSLFYFVSQFIDIAENFSDASKLVNILSSSHMFEEVDAKVNTV